MSAQGRSRDEQHDARREFLITGARSFLQGNAALAKFYDEVYRGCRKVLENRLPELEKALDLKIDPDQIAWEPAKWDLARLDLDQPSVFVGAGVQAKNLGRLRCYLWWRFEGDAQEPVISAVASIVLSSGAATQEWNQALTAVDPEVRRDDWELFVDRVLTAGESADFETILDQWLGRFATTLAKAKGRLKPKR